ncbi:hypothetical protein CH373_01020 [Leptospira perolatii]|uniref:Uncharacterized protein n=1 Tax=Leptospira perolatii TaxID=2023191 RepID=A0A2M9ZRJ6_9LEPT|nr:hypothetical protein [Leptospira perolatii]PJZ71132.1 hypothetical protein CH360_01020 [Leptospira perolatii]PJZ74664.1 hypothetical protein CH373_01020 [Leptospira perolatii]
MDSLKERLSGVGGFICIAGLASSGLSLIDYNLKILMWIDNWGMTVGWIIRVGLIVGGAALFFFTRKKS